MIYKLFKNPFTNEISSVVNTETTASIPFDPDNRDYANFKKQINAGEAQLEDADGNLMTPEEAKAYVATLP